MEKNFRYNELSSFDKGLNGFLKACTMLMILAFTIFDEIELFNMDVKKTIFPKPGEGPSRSIMQNGFLN